ncbi:MAG: DUF1189 family protein [Sedimentisphaerales bacterium]|nr:DUF1189 family protein [Sedimentisphaerales bacterium]
MKKFSIIHIPVLSFFSAELYRDIGLNWKGVAYGYLFLLLAICTVPKMFRIQKGLSTFIDEHAPAFVNQVPKITIEKGQVHIEEQQPYYIMAPDCGEADTNEAVAIIDTTGQILSLDNTDAFILLTKTKLLSRQSDTEVRTYDLTKVQHFVLEQSMIMKWLDIFKKLLVPVIYPFALGWAFTFRIIQSLIYAAIGLAFANWCKTKLSYPALIRLAVTAVTPAIIVRIVLETASVKIPFLGLWFFLAAMLFLLYGIKACAQVPAVTVEDSLRPGNQNQPPNY